MSQIEDIFDLQVKFAKLPEPVREHRFHSKRKWKFDFAWPELMIAVEIEGGTWANGRHTRGAGYEADCMKYSMAAIDGWTVIRATTTMVKKLIAIKLLIMAIDTKN